MAILDAAPAIATRRAAGQRTDRAGVRYLPGERGLVGETIVRLFGRPRAPAELARLAGAFPGAEVTLGTLQDRLYLEVYGGRVASYQGICLLGLAHGRIVLTIEAFHIRRRCVQRRGHGLRIFARQAFQAHRLGLARIETTGGRSGGENGYYTWPRFGFDGPLSPWVRRSLPAGLHRARSVLDLMETLAGRQWWKSHGTPMPLVFDLSAGSRCWRAFCRYLKPASAHPLDGWAGGPVDRCPAP